MSDDDEEISEADEAKLHEALSGLQKARAPDTFAQDVTSTIHKRSAGRFFARRTFGDRVPFGALAIIAVLGLCVLGFMMWAAQTRAFDDEHARGSADHGSGLKLTP